MNGKENAALLQQDGEMEKTAERTSNAVNSGTILRHSGFPVNGVFSCGFVRDVYDLLSEPRTLEEIAQQTESPVNRVVLALHDLRASGVIIWTMN